MHSCDEMTQLISAAIDGELSCEETSALNEHLNTCSVCRVLFDDLRALNNAAVDTDGISAPEGFTQQVMDRIAANPAQEASVIPFPAKRKLPSAWKKWALTAALFAVVVFGAYTLPGFFAMGGSAQESDSSLTRDQINASDGLISADADCADAVYDESSSVDNKESIQNSDNSSAGITHTMFFSAENRPDGLEEFPVTKSEEGYLIYTVPPDYFYSLGDGDNSIDYSADVTYLICITDS